MITPTSRRMDVVEQARQLCAPTRRNDVESRAQCLEAASDLTHPQVIELGVLEFGDLPTTDASRHCNVPLTHLGFDAQCDLDSRELPVGHQAKTSRSALHSDLAAAYR